MAKVVDLFGDHHIIMMRSHQPSLTWMRLRLFMVIFHL
jgi:hypothetical protein